MTRADEPLDPASIFRTPLSVYRIVRSKYADLSGMGAARSPGRWNRADQEMIYTSLNSSTAQLEVLGHTKKQLIPGNLMRMRIELAADWAPVNEDGQAPFWYRDRSAGAHLAVFRTIESAEKDLLRIGDLADPNLLAIGVPSVHDDQWNLLLRPSCLHFKRLVSLVEVRPFAFDARLFPEDALQEKT